MHPFQARLAASVGSLSDTDLPYGRLVILIPNMKMWQMVAILALKQQSGQNSVEHTDGMGKSL